MVTLRYTVAGESIEWSRSRVQLDGSVAHVIPLDSGTSAMDEEKLRARLVPSCTQPGPLPHTLELGGVGPLRIGMTAEEVLATGLLIEAEYFSTDLDTCGFAYPIGPYSHLAGHSFYAQFLDGVLQRINVTDDRLRSVTGLGVGSTRDDIVGVYGDRIVEGYSGYDRPPQDVLFVADGDLGILFMLSRGTADSVSIGETSALALIEGCS